MESNNKATFELKESLIVKEENKSQPECSSRITRAVRKTNEEAYTTQELEMVYNDLNIFASIKRDKELILDIHENFEPHLECCIYRVPKDLRKVNEEAYTPAVISIGPLHFGKRELFEMEKQKIRYVIEFNKRITVEMWQEFKTFIADNEQNIRNCYAEVPKFEKLEFTIMILYDAIFIIEYLLRWAQGENDFKSDSLFRNPRIRKAIWLDLQLLENQLPYFVLERLYNKLAFYTAVCLPFHPLSCLYLGRSLFNGIPEKVEVKHFTDLLRCIIKNRYNAEAKQKLRKSDKDLPCAVKLHESGVKFKCFKGEHSLIDIRFEMKKLLLMEAPELQIPHISIYDDTESLIRNVMALEQCHYPEETHVCNYISLMDLLINTEEDVNLLVEAGIISSRVGDSDKIAKMFNKLCTHISCSDSWYYDVKDLKAYYNSRWNHAKANLKRVYFSNPWRGTGTVAAVVLLLLTLVQTVCSIWQVL